MSSRDLDDVYLDSNRPLLMDNHTDSSDVRPLKRVRLLACQRCRVRKQKCDNVRPRCGNCVRSKADCIAIESNTSKRSQEPDSKIEALENRIRGLEQQLSSHETERENQSRLEIPLNTTTEFTANDQGIGRNDHAYADRQPIQTPADSRSPSHHDSDLPAIDGSSQSISGCENTHFANVANRYPLLATTSLNLSPNNEVAQIPHLYSLPTRLWTLQGVSDSESLRAICNLSEDPLVVAYFKYVHPQYPFLCKRKVRSAFRRWRQRLPTEKSWNKGYDALEEFTVYMVLSIGALITENSTKNDSLNTRILYKFAIQDVLPRILAEESILNQTTAFLLLAMKALHGSSSSDIIYSSSTATRTAIIGGLYRKRSDLDPFAEQLRRRIWWCCYALDRAVAMAFGHPVAIADEAITVEMFMDSPDADFLGQPSPADDDANIDLNINDVSIAYHLTFGRKIQSRIITTFQNLTIHPSMRTAVDQLRSEFCQELETWQASVPTSTRASSSTGYGSPNWFRMVAYYSVLGLVSDLKDDIRQSVGAKTMVACCNACISFRDIQRSRHVAQSWLAVLSQFQAGLTIIYCFWAVPREMRTPDFEPTYASRSVRTCSNNLVLLAEHWAEAETYRDAFEAVAKVVPVDNDGPENHRSSLSSSDVTTLESYIKELSKLGVHHQIIQMLDEICHRERPTYESYATTPKPQTVDEQGDAAQDRDGIETTGAEAANNKGSEDEENNAQTSDTVTFDAPMQVYGLGDPWANTSPYIDYWEQDNGS